MKGDKTVSIPLSANELEHLRWALDGFHQFVPPTTPVGANAAKIDFKLRDGLIALGTLAK